MLAFEFARDIKEDAAIVDDTLDVELVALRYFEVHYRVCGGDGHGARTERHVGRFVLDYRCSDGPVYPFEVDFLSVFVLLVPLVVGMHDDILIAELRLGAHGADVKRAVFEMVESIFLFDVLYFIVRHGRLQFRVPIDDAVTAVNEPRVIHANERLHHRRVAFLVHRV